MNSHKLSLNKVSFMTMILGIYYIVIAFLSLSKTSFFQANIYFEGISIGVSLIYIYILDRLKEEINLRLKFYILNPYINALIIIGGIAIVIDFAVKLNYFDKVQTLYVYTILIYIDSIATLLFIKKFKVLFILPHAKEFSKWSKLSSIFAMTLILYPLALLCNGFSLLSLSKFFNIVDKIKQKNN